MKFSACLVAFACVLTVSASPLLPGHFHRRASGFVLQNGKDAIALKCVSSTCLQYIKVIKTDIAISEKFKTLSVNSSCKSERMLVSTISSRSAWDPSSLLQAAVGALCNSNKRFNVARHQLTEFTGAGPYLWLTPPGQVLPAPQMQMQKLVSPPLEPLDLGARHWYACFDEI